MKKILVITITGLFLMLGATTALAVQTKTFDTNTDQPDFKVCILHHYYIQGRWGIYSGIDVSISNIGGYYDGVVEVLVTFPGGEEQRGISYTGTGESEKFFVLAMDENEEPILLGEGDIIITIVDPPDGDNPNGLIDESNETNNEKSITIKKSKPKPVIVNILDNLLNKFKTIILTIPLFNRLRKTLSAY